MRTAISSRVGEASDWAHTAVVLQVSVGEADCLAVPSANSRLPPCSRSSCDLRVPPGSVAWPLWLLGLGGDSPTKPAEYTALSCLSLLVRRHQLPSQIAH